MKLEEYKPFYDFFHALESMPTLIGGKMWDIAKEDFWLEYDLELSDWEIDVLDSFDMTGFLTAIKTLETERELIYWLQHTLSNWEENPLQWIRNTLFWVLKSEYRFEAWQLVIIQKWLSEKEAFHLKYLLSGEDKTALSLPEMFKDSTVLERITDQLNKKSFIKEGMWQGKKDSRTGKNPKEKQLAALALVIQEKKLLNNQYNDKETAIAFLNYFQLNTKGYYFKFGQRIQLEEYKRLFSFI